MSIPNHPNFGVSSNRGSDGTRRSRPYVQGQKDFQKVMKDKEEDRQGEQSIAEARQNDDAIEAKQASAKSKRPNPLSLAASNKADKEPMLSTHVTFSAAEEANTSEAEEEVEPDTSKIANADSASEAIGEAAAQAALATQSAPLGKSGSATDDEQSNKRGRKSSAELSQAQARQIQDPEGRVLKGLFSILNEEIPRAKKENASADADSPFALYQNINKAKDSPRVTQEQPDLAYVNPLGGSMHASAAAIQSSEAKAAPRTPYMQEIIEHMVKEMQMMQNRGFTETTITIQNSKMFEGAQLVLTGFDSAMKEYNISFQNLSPEAKQLLDLQQNQVELKKAMVEKGDTVHIIVTTTETENNYRGDGQRGEQGYAGREDESESENQS